MDFKQWLEQIYKKSNGQALSRKSVDHYISGLSATSRDMLKEGIISKSLKEMDFLELELAISIIMTTKSFIDKDQKGDKMYSNSLKLYRCFLFHNTDLGKREIDELEIIKNDKKLDQTEKEVLIKARKGQGLFRDKIKEKYNNRCIITDVDIEKVLIASHIKPWAISNNDERLSVNNGLLLSATFDRLFDSGLISFKKDGTILISNIISDENKVKLHLIEGKVYDIGYNLDMEPFLNYHNDVIYVGITK